MQFSSVAMDTLFECWKGQVDLQCGNREDNIMMIQILKIHMHHTKTLCLSLREVFKFVLEVHAHLT